MMSDWEKFLENDFEGGAHLNPMDDLSESMSEGKLPYDEEEFARLTFTFQNDQGGGLTKTGEKFQDDFIEWFKANASYMVWVEECGSTYNEPQWTDADDIQYSDEIIYEDDEGNPVYEKLQFEDWHFTMHKDDYKKYCETSACYHQSRIVL